MPIPVVAPLSPITVDGWDVVTLAASATNTPTSWSWTADGGVALTGTGASRTFTAPALWNGSTVTVTVTATNGSGTSAPVTATVTVRDWNSFVLTHAGTWTPRRPFARIPVTAAIYTGGVTGSNYPDIYSGGTVGSSLPDVYTGGAVLVITTRFGVAHLTGTGTLQAFSTSARVGTANLTGTGTLTAFAGSKKVGTASLTGTGTLTASGVVPPPPPPPPPPGNVPFTAQQFTDLVSVATHFNRSSYQNSDMVAAMGDIGFKHVRGAVSTGDATQPNYMKTLFNSYGIRSTLITGAPWAGPLGFCTTVSQCMTNAKNLYGNQVIEAFEGSNEPDNFGAQQVGSLWIPQTHSWMAAIGPAIHGDSYWNGIPLITCAMAQPTGISPYGNADSPYIDELCMHTYNWKLPEDPTGLVGKWINPYQAQYGHTKPMQVTEWGYHTGGTTSSNMDEGIEADYYIRSLLWWRLNGVRRMASYELLDEQDKAGNEAHFGLLRADHSYKPAATALKHFLGRIKDTGTGTAPSQYPFTTNASGDVHVVPIGRRDGKVDFAVWRAATLWDFNAQTRVTVSPVNVTFTLTTTNPQPVEAYKVTPGTLSSISSSTKSFTVAADGSVLLVRVG